MHSCIYRGQVSHRRFMPVDNRFRYPVFMPYIDLAEIPELFDRYWFWSARRRAPACFRREDHLGDPTVPLDSEVRNLVEQQAGFRPDGAIRLLTNLRYFGYCFNPMSAYYCFDRSEVLVAVVLEVSNMPWRQMHPYVLTAGAQLANGAQRFEFAKTFHVSPFMPMDMRYRCTLTTPGDRLLLGIENWRGTKRVFDAYLNFHREPVTGPTLARILATDPLITLRVVALIHWQALKLWRQRAPVYDRPKTSAKPG
ncbi:MAG: DUF1365 domain-containing protein [Gammaproteobacteria bacterium]